MGKTRDSHKPGPSKLSHLCQREQGERMKKKKNFEAMNTFKSHHDRPWILLCRDSARQLKS